MAVQFTQDRVPEAETLAFQGEAPGGKIDQLPAPGLSGKAGRFVAGLNDQLGQDLPFTLARRAQSGLLLVKSIWGMHKRPVNGLRKCTAWEPVTPEGAAEDADCGLLFVVRQAW
jgi:hypothetical protein